MSTFNHLRINLFRGSTNSQPVKVLSLAEALHAIQDGTYRQNVQQLRDILRTRGKPAYDAEKKQLDAVTFCGTFSPTRAKARLVEHNGIVHGDIDHLDDPQAVKQRLCADRYTVYCFDSPSGIGLKVGVRVKPVENDAAYKHAWQAVATYHQQHYGIVWDERRTFPGSVTSAGTLASTATPWRPCSLYHPCSPSQRRSRP
jgi:hypothetical protein